MTDATGAQIVQELRALNLHVSNLTQLLQKLVEAQQKG